MKKPYFMIQACAVRLKDEHHLVHKWFPPVDKQHFLQILDLIGLYWFLKTLRFCIFRLPNIIPVMKPKDCIMPVAMHNAYFHIPISPKHKCFLNQNPSLQPLSRFQVFTKCMQAVLSPQIARCMKILL